MNNLAKQKFFIIFFIIIFSLVLGISLIIPIFPIYASMIGYSGVEIGLILGSFSFSRGIFLIYFGKKFDIIKKKSHIIIGLIIYTLIPIGFVLCQNWKLIVFFRIIQGIASSIIVSFVYTYIAKFVPKGNEGKITGIFNISVFTGMVFGPSLGGLFIDKFGNSSVFLLMCIISLLSLIISILLIPSKFIKKNKNKNNKFHWLIILGELPILGLVFLRLSYTFCISLVWNFLPILSFSEYNLSFISIGIIFTFGVFISGILNIPSSLISDIIDRKIIIISGTSFFFVPFFLLFFLCNFWHFFFINIFFGIGLGILNPTTTASSIVIGNKNNASGFTVSLFTTSHSIGMVLGSVLSGYIIYFKASKYILLCGFSTVLLGLYIFNNLVKQSDIIHQPF